MCRSLVQEVPKITTRTVFKHEAEIFLVFRRDPAYHHYPGMISVGPTKRAREGHAYKVTLEHQTNQDSPLLFDDECLVHAGLFHFSPFSHAHALIGNLLQDHVGVTPPGLPHVAVRKETSE